MSSSASRPEEAVTSAVLSPSWGLAGRSPVSLAHFELVAFGKRVLLSRWEEDGNSSSGSSIFEQQNE